MVVTRNVVNVLLLFFYPSSSSPQSIFSVLISNPFVFSVMDLLS